MLAPKCPNTIRQVLLYSCFLLMISVQTFALTLYVDNDKGSDLNVGATEKTALRTLGTALTIAQWLGQGETTILVAPGVYTETSNRNLVLNGQSLNIIATGPAGSSIIDLQQDGNFLTIDNGANVILQNLTIQNGFSSYENASVVDIYDGTLTAIDCRLKDNGGPGEVIYAADGSLVMQNCILDERSESTKEPDSASISSRNADVALLNCTLMGDGLLLSSLGETTLNNTIIDGESQLPYSTTANNCYAWDDLSDLGDGNIQGTSPGLNDAGAIADDSPCVSSGNDDYYVDSDLQGTARTPGAVSIGALEPEPASAAAESDDGSEQGFFPRPSMDSNHVCDLRVEANKKDAFELNKILIDCGTFHSFGRNFSTFANYVRENVSLSGKCRWATFNPNARAAGMFANDMTYTTATTNAAAYATLSVQQPHYGGLKTHQSFASQFAAGYFMFPVTFNCVEKNSQYVDVNAQDHILKWTDTAPENRKCAMVGRINHETDRNGIPKYATRRSMILPYGAVVPLAVEWTGGDSYKYASWECDDDAPDAGALLLTHKKCTVCSAEERLASMPADYNRMLLHACLYQTPENYYDEAFQVASRDGCLRENDMGYIDYYGAGLQKFASNSSCVHDFINIGHDTATFRKYCLPYTAEAAHWHPNLSGELFADVEVPQCGSAEFTFDAEVIGIKELTVAPGANSSASSLLTLDAEVANAYDADGIILTAREVTEEEANARFKPRRSAAVVDFTAYSTSGNGALWPTPDDHPIYGDIDDAHLDFSEREKKLLWRFPMWIGTEEMDAFDGDPTITREFRRRGWDSVTASCYDVAGNLKRPYDEGLLNNDLISKCWRIATGDICVTLGTQYSPMPMLLLNDNNESGCAWPDPLAVADKERQGPIDYVDSDLKPLTITLDSVFSSLAPEILDRLAVRVDVQGDSIRLFEDQKKNPVGSCNPRWSSSQNACYYELDGKLQNRSGGTISCTIYAEGVNEGIATIKATLVEKGSANADTGISESLELTVVRAGLVPDYNCDGKIDGDDADFAAKGRVFRMWTNDNGDKDKMNQWDFEANGNTNCNDGVVNGRGDLLDFFPLWLDTKKFLAQKPAKGKLSMKLRHTWSKVNAVYTDISPSDLVEYMRSDSKGNAIPVEKGGERTIFCADTNALISAALPEDFLQECAAGKGIALCEGNLSSAQPCPGALVLELLLELDGTMFCLAERTLPTSISSVSGMYRTFNLRGCEKSTPASSSIDSYLPAEQLADPPNMPDCETEEIKVYFVHGFAMDQKESYNWMGRLFKRLYRSGISCRFVGVDWKSDSFDSVGCYQLNVENAFHTAPFLKALVDKTSSSGEKKVFIAHSLGNMLVSAAIEDHKMTSDLFMLVNAAVASEAYDESEYSTDETDANKMLPVEWREYAHKSRSAEWHTHHPNDNRSTLTWKGRFKNMLGGSGKFVNFYDSKDEVIRVISAERIGVLTGASIKEAYNLCELTRRRLSWQKQEFFKGTLGLNTLGCTSEAGWGKEKVPFWSHRHWEDEPCYRFISKEESKASNWDFGDFSKAIFRHEPETMNDPNLSPDDGNHLLAYAIPAISSSAGSKNVKGFDHSKDLALLPTKGWPRDTSFILNQKNTKIEMPTADLIWCHSDFMLVPYFYTHEMYEDMKKYIDSIAVSNP